MQMSIFPQRNELSFKKDSEDRSFTHMFIEHLLCSGGSAVGAEKNGVLVFKALAGPWGKQTNQINSKITQEVPQIPSVQNTGRLHLTQSEKPGRASWKS